MNYGTKAFGMFGPAKNIAKKGRFGDTLLAHINPQEAKMLKRMGGSGTINPFTGALEFFTPNATREDFDPEFYLAQNRDVARAGYGTGEGQMDPFEHYNQFVLQGDEKRAGNIQEQQERDLGSFTGVFDEDFYLSNNQDVADALAGDQLGDIKTAQDHFLAFGREEGRTSNQMQQDLLMNEDSDITRFGSDAFGNPSDRAIQRRNLFTGENQAEGGVPFPNVLNVDGTRLREDIVGEDTPFAIDLFGGTADQTNRELANRLRRRATNVEGGFTGQFDPELMTAFENAYTDFDNDPSTPFTAGNESNISTAGLDVTGERNRIRNLGYEGRFGAGGPEAFINEKLGELGMVSTGNPTNDMALIESRQQYDKLQADLIKAIEDITGIGGTDDEASEGDTTTLPITTDPVDEIATEAATEVAIELPDLPFNTTSPAPTFAGPAGPMQSFRPTRINPFTGALEYLPTTMPSAFSQRAMNPRFTSGFGQGIRL